MRTTLVLLAALAGFGFSSLGLAAQTVWKWVDENGVTHYADRPVPGATRMEISTGTNVSSPAPVTASSSASAQPANSGPPYRNFEIWKPGNDETIPNTGGQVTVNVRVDPQLQAGHSLALYLDGRLVEGFPDNTESFDLTEVPRGQHTLRAIITDGRGNRVQETDQVMFMVRQESIGQPPVGPTLRPPPKPQPRPRGASNKLPTSQPSYVSLHPEVQTARIDPATNRPVVTKPATNKPTTPKGK